MSKNIQDHLKGNPKIVEIYVNEAGQWLHYPRPGFTKKTRDELLGNAKPAAAPEQTETEPPKKQSNPKK